MLHSQMTPHRITDPDPDAELEHRITAALDASQAAKKAGDGVTASEKWAEFVALVASRSPEQVAKLEKQQGLL